MNSCFNIKDLLIILHLRKYPLKNTLISHIKYINILNYNL